MAYTLNPSVTLPFSEGTQFTPNDSNGVVNYASGYIVMDSSTTVAVVVPIGFHPRKIRVVNITNLNAANGGELEYLDFMNEAVAGTALLTKYTSGAGVKTLDTTGMISIGTDAAGTERTFTIAASFLTLSDTYVFEATA
jgi:hypothetical protein